MTRQKVKHEFHQAMLMIYSKAGKRLTNLSLNQDLEIARERLESLAWSLWGRRL